MLIFLLSFSHARKTKKKHRKCAPFQQAIITKLQCKIRN